MQPKASTYTRIYHANIFPQFWGLKHNHTKINKPLSVYCVM